MLCRRSVTFPLRATTCRGQSYRLLDSFLDARRVVSNACVVLTTFHYLVMVSATCSTKRLRESFPIGQSGISGWNWTTEIFERLPETVDNQQPPCGYISIRQPLLSTRGGNERAFREGPGMSPTDSATFGTGTTIRVKPMEESSFSLRMVC